MLVTAPAAWGARFTTPTCSLQNRPVARSRLAHLVVFVSWLGAILLWTDGARADDALDRARAHLERAEFAQALTALEEAAGSTDLTEAEVVHLAELRALAHHAIGEDGQMRSDLLLLALLEPEHSFDPAVPPAVRRAFDRLAGEVREPRLRVDVQNVPGGARVVARLEEPSQVVRAVRVLSRVPGGTWLTSDGELQVPAAAGTTLELYAEAVGPGGWVLAREGSASEPLTARVAAAAAAPPSAAPPMTPEEEQESGDAVWPFLVGGAALAAAVAVVVALLVTSSGDEGTQLGAPTADWDTP